MPGYNLKSGAVAPILPSEDDLWAALSVVFSTKSVNDTSYKFGFLKSLLDNLYNVDGDLRLGFSTKGATLVKVEVGGVDYSHGLGSFEDRIFNEVKPELDRVYKEIVTKKKEYASASPVRQRLLKTELQTLMTKYKGLEREFNILCENERSIEAVKGRFLEVLAHGLRGKLNAEMVENLPADIDDKTEEAEDLQDALGDLERAGKRKERGDDNFDAELAGFDGEDIGLFGNEDSGKNENNTEQAQTDRADTFGDDLAGFDVKDPA